MLASEQPTRLPAAPQLLHSHLPWFSSSGRRMDPLPALSPHVHWGALAGVGPGGLAAAVAGRLVGGVKVRVGRAHLRGAKKGGGRRREK